MTNIYFKQQCSLSVKVVELCSVRNLYMPALNVSLDVVALIIVDLAMKMQIV